MTAVSTTGARNILCRFGAGAALPEALLAILRDEVVLAGWLRASGVLADVELRVLDPRAGAPGPVHKLAGNVQVIALEGSIGLANGDVSTGLRAVLVREGALGLETIAGDLVGGRVVALEAWISAFDELTAERKLDAAGVWLADATAVAPRTSTIVSPAATTTPPVHSPANLSIVAAPAASNAATPEAHEEPAPPATPSGFADVVRRESEAIPPAAAEEPRPAAPKPSPTFSPPGGMPLKPIRPVKVEEEEQLLPEAGDTVEHFAFGRCEVVKTDGDRLHVRLGKDGRIKEIALEMLKVSPLPAAEGQTTRHFKLARKL